MTSSELLSKKRPSRVQLVVMLGAMSLAFLQLAFLAALAAAEPLLAVRTGIAAADVIVVPGGDAPRRAVRAAALYRDGVAPRILVTGDGDCDEIRALLIAEGVSPTAITVECASRSTWENARLSAPILNEIGARRAVLVTSWFHTRTAAPQVRWMSAPVEREALEWGLAQYIESVQIAKEYLKIGWYILRHDIDLRPSAATRSGGAGVVLEKSLR